MLLVYVAAALHKGCVSGYSDGPVHELGDWALLLENEVDDEHDDAGDDADDNDGWASCARMASFSRCMDWM